MTTVPLKEVLEKKVWEQPENQLIDGWINWGRSPRILVDDIISPISPDFAEYSFKHFLFESKTRNWWVLDVTAENVIRDNGHVWVERYEFAEMSLTTFPEIHLWKNFSDPSFVKVFKALLDINAAANFNLLQLSTIANQNGSINKEMQELTEAYSAYKKMLANIEDEELDGDLN